MKVCLFSHDFRPSIGGLETASELLAGYLADAGHDVVVVTRTPLGQSEDKGTRYPIIRKPPWRDLIYLLRTCDVVHATCTSLGVVAAARRARVPLVLTHSSFSPRMRRNLRNRRSYLSREETWRVLHAWASRVAMHLSAENTCVSNASLEALRPPHGVVLSLPIEVGSMFRPMRDIVPTDRLAFAGRLVVHKGCDVLVHALSICRQRGHRFGLDVYGDGPDRSRLVRLARRHGLDDGDVGFHGFVSSEELVRAYNGAFALVVPSLWDEPLGMVAIEAMACGRAVVASAAGGLGEVVAGRGLVFPPGDADELARRLVELRENPSLRRRFEAEGPAFADLFRVDQIGPEYVLVYQSVAAHSRRRRGTLDHPPSVGTN
jgi:glycogen synthase